MRRTDYVWNSSGNYTMPCWECGQKFTAQRKDACYCSPNCRKKANRRKAQVQEAVQLVVEQLKFLQKTRDLRPDLARDVQAGFNAIKWQLGVTAGTSQLVVQLET